MYTTTNDKTLLEHIICHDLNNICDEFIAISGYIGPDPIIQFSEKKINMKIYYGMANETLNYKFDKKLKELDREYTNLQIYYPTIAIHSKIYIWKKNNTIIGAFCGSANFSSNSLLKINRDVLLDVDKDDYTKLNEYQNLIQNSSIRCKDYLIEKESNETDECLDSEICTSSPLFGNASKINWGHSPNGHVNKRDSYISVRKKDIRNYPKLFPPKEGNAGLGYADNEPIEVIWDDGSSMVCLLEGSQTINGMRYPNKISSYGSKKIIGDYIRKRMNILPGTFVSESDFHAYGRNNIEISLISDNVYYFNFELN